MDVGRLAEGVEAGAVGLEDSDVVGDAVAKGMSCKGVLGVVVTDCEDDPEVVERLMKGDVVPETARDARAYKVTHIGRKTRESCKAFIL